MLTNEDGGGKRRQTGDENKRKRKKGMAGRSRHAAACICVYVEQRKQTRAARPQHRKKHTQVLKVLGCVAPVGGGGGGAIEIK